MLAWEDIDLENRIIYIRHNVYRKLKEVDGILLNPKHFLVKEKYI